MVFELENEDRTQKIPNFLSTAENNSSKFLFEKNLLAQKMCHEISGGPSGGQIQHASPRTVKEPGQNFPKTDPTVNFWLIP